MNGAVKPPKSDPGNINLRMEFKRLKAQIAAFRGVREVYADRVRIFD
jgi:hypothetical protein